MARFPKTEDVDYIQFLLAAQTVFTCNEAARCYGEQEHKPAHDTFSRLLTRRPPDTEALWTEVQPLVDKATGILVGDDSTLDKPYAHHIDLVAPHWSGKHKRVVRGINLTTLLWTDGGAKLPVDCRILDPKGEATKHDHFQQMLGTARQRGFTPECVCFDSWYSSLKTLKLIRSWGWRWLTVLACDRQVDPDGSGNVRVDSLEIGPEGRVVHLRGYGLVRVFREVRDFDVAAHWTTNALNMDEAERVGLALQAWGIEEYHRGLKQFCGVERCQSRRHAAQKNHILFSVRAFVRLEAERLHSGRSWFSIKHDLIREAIRRYLAQPSLLSATIA